MPDVGDSFEWDFLTLAAWWNLYGLPVLLLAIATVTILARRRRGPAALASLDGNSTVRRVGLIHYAMALRALIQLVQELLALRIMGIPQSFPVFGLIPPAIALLLNPLFGLGL